MPSLNASLEAYMSIDTHVRETENVGLPRTIFVVGPTASGKTELSIDIAKAFNGEIINADSRQLYQKVDIGTGKPTGVRGEYEQHGAFMYKGIPHYLMDFLPPTETYSAPQWREAAMKAVRGITRRGHVPIVVGGTGLYITSIVDNLRFPDVEPHKGLREAFEEKALHELVSLLLKLDGEAGNIIDLKNKRRVIRALEVVTFTGEKFSELRKRGTPLVDPLLIGIWRSQEELNTRIDAAIEKMLKKGLIREVRMLLREGVPEDAPALTAIGYRDFASYLRGDLTLHDAIEKLKKHTRDYAKRQRTWFKKDQRIHWVKTESEGMALVRDWLQKEKRA